MTRELTRGKIDIELLLLLYAAFFLPKIGIIDLKSIVIAVIAIAHIKSSKFKYQISKYNKTLFVSLFLLIVLFLFNSLINSQNTINILLRYFRALLSLICLGIIFLKKKYNQLDFFKTLFCVMSFHIIAIFVAMLFPALRSYINILSGYKARELGLRSTGLVSGYDVAGFYLNILLVINVYYNLKYKNRPFSLYSLLIMIATVFTSRLNMLFLIIQIIFIILYLLKKKKLSVGLSLLIIIPILFAGSVFSILTLDMFSTLKSYLLARSVWIQSLNKIVIYSYSTGSVNETLGSHYNIGSEVNILLGNAIVAPYDPGYINTIYEGGLLALAIKSFCFLYIGLVSYIDRKNSSFYLLISYIVLVTLIYEFKLVFFFASGVFELLLIFIFMSQNTQINNEFPEGEHT